MPTGNSKNLSRIRILYTSLLNFDTCNGEIESAVQTAKTILRKNANIYLGLLTYRSTLLRNGATLSEIVIERRFHFVKAILVEEQQ